MNIHSTFCFIRGRKASGANRRPLNRAPCVRRGLLAGSVAGLLLWSVGVASAAEGLIPEAVVGPAPPFHLRDPEGRLYHLQAFRGRPLIVNFWASWCTPCRRELPSMNRAWAELKPQGVAMLAINLGEEAEAVKGFLAEFPIDFPVLLDPRGNIGQRWRVRGLPTTFVLNGRGEIVYRATGERAWDDPDLLRQVLALRFPETGRPGAGETGPDPARERARTDD